MTQIKKRPGRTPRSILWNNFGRRPICGYSGEVRQNWYAIIERLHGRTIPNELTYSQPDADIDGSEAAVEPGTKYESPRNNDIVTEPVKVTHAYPIDAEATETNE